MLRLTEVIIVTLPILGYCAWYRMPQAELVEKDEIARLAQALSEKGLQIERLQAELVEKDNEIARLAAEHAQAFHQDQGPTYILFVVQRILCSILLRDAAATIHAQKEIGLMHEQVLETDFCQSMRETIIQAQKEIGLTNEQVAEKFADIFFQIMRTVRGLSTSATAEVLKGNE